MEGAQLHWTRVCNDSCPCMRESVVVAALACATPADVAQAIVPLRRAALWAPPGYTPERIAERLLRFVQGERDLSRSVLERLFWWRLSRFPDESSRVAAPCRSPPGVLADNRVLEEWRFYGPSSASSSPLLRCDGATLVLVPRMADPGPSRRQLLLDALARLPGSAGSSNEIQDITPESRYKTQEPATESRQLWSLHKHTFMSVARDISLRITPSKTRRGSIWWCCGLAEKRFVALHVVCAYPMLLLAFVRDCFASVPVPGPKRQLCTQEVALAVVRNKGLVARAPQGMHVLSVIDSALAFLAGTGDASPVIKCEVEGFPVWQWDLSKEVDLRADLAVRLKTPTAFFMYETSRVVVPPLAPEVVGDVKSPLLPFVLDAIWHLPGGVGNAEEIAGLVGDAVVGDKLSTLLQFLKSPNPWALFSPDVPSAGRVTVLPDVVNFLDSSEEVSPEHLSRFLARCDCAGSVPPWCTLEVFSELALQFLADYQLGKDSGTAGMSLAALDALFWFSLSRKRFVPGPDSGRRLLFKLVAPFRQTFRDSTEAEREQFRLEERLRVAEPRLSFTYTHSRDGPGVAVPPAGLFTASTSALVASDAAARMPCGVGTTADVLALARDSGMFEQCRLSMAKLDAVLSNVATVSWYGEVGLWVAVLVLCALLVRHYKDRHNCEAFPTFVSTVAISVVLICLILVPVDIFLVSSSVDANGQKIPDSQIRARGDVLKYTYLSMYAVLLALASFVVPFAYFYYEEWDSEDPSVRRRVLGALKYTVFTVVLVVILLIIGFFVRTGSPAGLDPGSASEWWQRLKEKNGSFSNAIGFIVGCLTVVGLAVWLSYTALGMSSMPMALIKGRRQALDEASDVQRNLERTRRRTREINSRYASGKRLSKRDEQRLDLLQRQEKVYLQHGRRLSQEQGSWGAKAAAFARPVGVCAGVALVLWALLIVASVLMTQVDKVLYARCGYKCGYMLSMPRVDNPLDLALVALAKFFPLDYIVVGAVILFFFFCTISGLKYIGIRFFWIHLFDFKAHRTEPQGLLLGSVFLMLSLLCLNMELLTIVPRYATFGTQTYMLNGTKTRCDLTAPVEQCTMTQVASFLNIVTGVNQSFLGIIFYYATWIFLVMWLLGLIVTAIRRRPANVEVTEDDVLEEEDRRNGDLY
eukprot:m51a1_g4106 hypothetical protein (1152) ;mRNA; f:113401-117734